MVNMKNRLISLLFFCIFNTVFAQNKELGEEFIHTLLIEKNYGKAYTFLDENLKSKISVSGLDKTLDQLSFQIGFFTRIIEINGDGKLFHYYSEFSKLNSDINISFDESHKITGFYFQPHKEVAVSRLGEDLNILSNDIELKGTLLKIKENNLKQLVIFVHGSGPNDRDASILENKPFMQIAEELYKNGISSYRFDKRTLTAPNSLKKQYTVDDEVTDDVLNIIEYFSKNTEFKEYTISLMGHSLGAFMLPKIANQSENISKIIMLAGHARPLEQLLIEQLEYINTIDSNVANKLLLEDTRKKVDFLQSKQFNLDSTEDKLPLSIPASYWNSLKEYKHLKEAEMLQIPVFVAQGERDYQVTMEDYRIWQKTFRKNNKAAFISYPNLNHLFMPGVGKSKPDEYRQKGDVDQALITDIVNFIKTIND